MFLAIVGPTNKRLLTPRQQTTFKIIVTKGEIAHNEQFLHLPQLFQLYSIIILSILDIFYILDLIISKSSAADLLYVGKGG